MNLIQTKVFSASSSNLADMLTMVNRIEFVGHGPKLKVTMGIIDNCGVRGDAMLCVGIFGFHVLTNSCLAMLNTNNEYTFITNYFI